MKVRRPEFESLMTWEIILGAGHFTLIKEKAKLEISSSFQNCKFSYPQKRERLRVVVNKRPLFDVKRAKDV